MKWLITGGCGFLGTSLIRNLIHEGGHSIRLLDNLSIGTRADLSSVTPFVETPASKITAIPPRNAVELVVGDIQDKDLLRNSARGADIIVHLAANTGVEPSVNDPEADCLNNVIGTMNALEAARHNNVNRFVFASSGAPAGECDPPIHENVVPRPVSPYGASKLAGEGYCSAYFRTFGVETVALRFGNVYGPGSGHKSSVVAKFIKRAMDGEVLEIYGDGSQTRDFIYVDDLISAVRKAAMVENIGGEIFQIATNAETSVNTLVEEMLPLLEAAGIQNICLINGAKRQGDVMRNYSDTSKAKEILGWQAQTSRTQGLENTIAWFIELQKDEATGSLRTS